MSTKRFKWITRDQAAQDLLQLAYYAPTTISHKALVLLRAIRSPVVVDPLIEIAFDPARTGWERRYALSALTTLPDDPYLPQLAPYFEQALAQPPTWQTRSWTDSATLLGPIIELISSLVRHSPSNEDWFFRAIENAGNLHTLCEFLATSMSDDPNHPLTRSLRERLCKLLDEHPELWTPSIARKFYYQEDEEIQFWLNTHLDRIVEVYARYKHLNGEILSLAYRWAALREKLIAKKPEWEVKIHQHFQRRETLEQSVPPPQAQRLPAYEQSPAYRLLENLSQAIHEGDAEAYRRLLNIVQDWQGNIPLRAAAVHFVGMVDSQRYPEEVLLTLMIYARDDWPDDDPLSPIRIEAGNILIRHPSPTVWEGMVDAYFGHTRNFLALEMHTWISYLTDVLSNVETTSIPTPRIIIGERSKWFKSLAEITEDELRQYQ